MKNGDKLPIGGVGMNGEINHVICSNGMSCKTCGSNQECEEDKDNPGCYYCKSCWEEYNVIQSQQKSQGRLIDENMLHSQNRLAIKGRVATSTMDSEKKDNAGSSATQTPTKSEPPMESAREYFKTTPFRSDISVGTYSHELLTQTLTPDKLSHGAVPTFGVEGVQKDSSISQLLFQSRDDEKANADGTYVYVKCGEGYFQNVESNADALLGCKCQSEKIHCQNSNPPEDEVFHDKCVSQKATDRGSCSGADSGRTDECESASQGGMVVPRGCSDKIDQRNLCYRNSNSDNDTKEIALSNPATNTDVEGMFNADDDNAYIIDSIAACDDGDGRNEGSSCNAKEISDRTITNVIFGVSNPATNTDVDVMFNSGDDTAYNIDSIVECDDGNERNEGWSCDAKEISNRTNTNVIFGELNGLLTQAGDEYDDNCGDEGESADGVIFQSVCRPPTIINSEYALLSGLTGPSQNPAISKADATETFSSKIVESPDTPIDECTEETVDSLYGAETQLLPSATLIILSGSLQQTPFEHHDLGKQDVDESPDKNDSQNTTSSPHVILNSSAVIKNDDLISKNQLEICNIRETECSDVGKKKANGESEKESEKADIRCSELEHSPPRLPDNHDMKHTPDVGLLSMISYPNELVEEINSPELASSQRGRIHRDDNRQSTSQELSQDLLEISQRETESINAAISQDRKEHRRDDKLIWKTCIDSSTPLVDLPESKVTTDTTDANNSNNPLDGETTFLDEGDSDDNSLFNTGNSIPKNNDEIEDTQTQDIHLEHKTSSLKRLSRGTSNSSPIQEGSSNESSKTANIPSYSTNRADIPHVGCKLVITPKILHYCERGDFMSQSEGDGGSCSDIDPSGYYVDQSNVTYCARKQLEAAKRLTKQLPTLEEMKMIATGKQILDENADLRRFHADQINGLTTELRKSRKIVKEKDEIISRQRQELQEKNALINAQCRTIKDFMTLLGAISSPTPANNKNDDKNDADSSGSDDEVSQVLSSLKNRVVSGKTSKSVKRRASPERMNDRAEKPKLDEDYIDKTRPFLPSMWKILQQKGWKYKTGPEPYNKVYVPPDGATHAGTKLGIHFFLGETVVDEATKRGHIEYKTSSNHMVDDFDQIGKNQAEGDRLKAMDDSKLCGEQQLITLETGKISILLAADFMSGKDESSFVGGLFNPIWQRLKVQGGELNLNWRYESSKMSSLSRNWCFVPPTTRLGSKGVKGVDFYLTEEEVVHRVLQEAVTLTQLSSLVVRHLSSHSALSTILARAVSNNMEYKDALCGNSPNSRTRRTPDSVQEESMKRTKSLTSKSTRTPVNAEKRKSSLEMSGSTKKKKRLEATKTTISPSFHSSQTQGFDAAPSFRSLNAKSNGPLSQFGFFYSGIDKKLLIDTRIRKLGGRIVSILDIDADKSHGKLFFLSDYTAWRRPKYIFAAAVGVPMLHHNWLVELEERISVEQSVTVMNSDLYRKYRLPIGLDHSSGVFVMQRASNARDWLRPGLLRNGGGSLIFEGMTIALTVETATEAEWRSTLLALGASVITTSSLKGKGKIDNADCCLLSSAILPPHVTSIPLNVSEMKRHIPDNVPLLDLAWAHQCIIQRRLVPLHENPRYKVFLDDGVVGISNDIYSIKTKSGQRFEVGDLVQFSRGTRARSFGRVLHIVLEKQGNYKLEIQLLEKTGKIELTDCISSPKITIDERSLEGNIIMLSSKDTPNLGYIPSSAGINIFQQIKPWNESQM